MSNLDDFDECIWETEEFFCFMLVCCIHIYNNARNNRPRLTRSAIVHPSLAPWERLLNFGDDGSFLCMTGFTRESFVMLENILKPPQPIINSGRPSNLNFRGQLGLFLMWCCSRMKIKELCLIFGCTQSPAQRYIRTLLCRMAPILRENMHARIKFPDEPELIRLAALVQLREPLIENICDFIDGCSIKIECASDSAIQNAHYDGFICDTTINNVFLFSPEGKVLYAAYNFPGSWHDSSAVASDLIHLVISKPNFEFAFCVDQGFPRSGRLEDRFVGPYSKTFLRKLIPSIRTLILRKVKRYVSLRQSAEWGMRALQGTFTRLKSRLTANSRMRALIIETILLLINFRTTFVGLNQIATVFNPHY